MSNFDKHVLAFFPHPYTLRANSTIQRLQSIRKIINFWYTFGWKWWVISFRDYLGLSDACSDDVIGRADRFGFQNFCNPGSIIGVGEKLHKVLGQVDLGTLDSGERSLPFGLLVFRSYGPWKLWAFKIYQQDNSKTIRAKDLKLCQLIGDDG